MRPSNIEEYKKKPNLTLDPEHCIDTAQQEEEEIFLLFSADAWHSTSSKELVGVFSDRDKLDDYLCEMERQGELIDEDIAMLNRIEQTQGRDINYSFTTEKINPKYEQKR